MTIETTPEERAVSSGLDEFPAWDAPETPPPLLASCMTLRDHFAAAALAGFFARGSEANYHRIADECYIVADYLISARGGA